MAEKNTTNRLPDWGHLRLFHRPGAVLRRVAGREQQPISLPQRDLKLLGKVQDHLGARLRPPRLDEAQMPSRDARVEREVQLAEPSPLSPVAEHGADAIVVHARERSAGHVALLGEGSRRVSAGATIDATRYATAKIVDARPAVNALRPRPCWR